MKKQPSLGNYLAEIASLDSREEAITALVLVNHKVPQLSAVLQLAFNENIEFLMDLGPFDIPQPSEPYDLEGTLIVGLKKIGRFIAVDGIPQNPQLDKDRRKVLYSDWLSEMPQEDQDLMLAVKDKKLPDSMSSITWDMVNEAFPGTMGPAPKVKKKNVKNSPIKTETEES
jgi:hypothetical protein